MTDVVVSTANMCHRRHLSEATTQELLERINAASRLRPDLEGQYGPMNVFREYRPKKECIEYTVYFFLPGDVETKYRLDTEVTLEDLSAMKDPEGEIHAKIMKMIADHEYRLAYKQAW